MATDALERIIIPMDSSLLESIDDYRFTNRMRSRAEAIRALIRSALVADLTVQAGVVAGKGQRK
jgi:metal-responsive CopG/Arc/MetJ family transcriptional regulator